MLFLAKSVAYPWSRNKVYLLRHLFWINNYFYRLKILLKIKTV